MTLTRPMAGSKRSAGHKVRGVRGAQDIIDAAKAQGWVFERCNSGSTHSRLTPPNGGVPVGVAGTPSDTNYRMQIIRQMRKSGFVWPWPPPVVKAPPPLRHEWVPVPKCSAYEFSNGGICRNVITLKEVTPAENGILVLTDDHGRRKDFSVTALCRAAFEHRPIKALAERYHTEKETLMSIAMDTDEELDSGQDETTPRWELVLIEGVTEGYEVSEAAQVSSPPNFRRKGRALVKVLGNGSSRPQIFLRRVDGRQKRFFLDEIVLEAFEARPGLHWMPKHIDGDLHNCTRANLCWVEGVVPKESPVIAPTPPTTVAEMEAHLDRLDEAAAAAREQRELDELREAKVPLPAEAFGPDYPESPEAEEEDRPPTRTRQRQAWLDKAFSTTVFETPTPAPEPFDGYPEDHMAQDEKMVDENMGRPAQSESPINIVSSHLYTDTVSGLHVEVAHDGKINHPEITMENLEIIHALLSSARIG